MACKDSYTQQRRSLLRRAPGSHRRLHHFSTSERMQREQAYARQFRCGGNGPGNRARNIVKLEIEKYAVAHPSELPDYRGPLSRKQSAPDLQHPNHATELPRQGTRVPGVVNIQSDDYSG